LAVAGCGARLPGDVDDARSLWALLAAGGNAVAPAPWNRRGNGRPSGYLGKATLEGFDPGAFGMAPAEAAVADPQQRLALFCAAEALQVAWGDAPGEARDRDVAVFRKTTEIGASKVGNFARLSCPGVGAIAVVSNRVSYCLDLRGAAVSLDTACSSALVALDAAASRLTRGDETAALVGAANVQLVASWSEAFVVAGMLSPRHRCAFGDDGADGYVRGEGVAFACVSATASAATAFVESTAVNQDGRSNGLTAPNPAAQARMLRAAVGSRRKLDVGYVEAHGTGTRLGDPIELDALGRSLREGPGAPLATASVKSNLGHLECAAGAAALAKLGAAFDRRALPRSLHVRRLNAVVDWAADRVFVVARATRDAAPRLCGCNGFGFAGTNAHALLSRPPRP
ncbi:hypothetical protein AURANDRAFT_11050, partial [Aureococcus anophagefferens]